MMLNKEIRKNLMYQYLLLLTIASAVGLQGWRTLFNNFAVESAGIDGFWVGLIQSIREVPGFLALLVIYLLLLVREDRLSGLSVCLLAVGVAATGLFPTPLGLVLTTLTMSTGFHFFETTNQSLTLQYFNKTDASLVMGSLRSFSALANIAVGAFIWVISQYFSFAFTFVLIGILVGLAGIRSFFLDPANGSVTPQKKKIVFRKKYWLFYLLNLFSGARRQIFIVFAVFLLVEYYHFSLQAITILFIINNLVNFFVAPLIARAVNLFGERKVLSLEYGSLILVFLAYAFVDNPWIVAGLYILDHLFFNFSIAIKTYFQKTADAADIAPSMAVSFTINHVTAVFLPFLGGLLWMVSRKIPFVLGAALSLVSLIFVQFIKYDKDY